MALSAGTHLGSYEILSALGVGGMGEVYRARDATLNRDVAIKVLLPAVANDPERLLRFRREAQVLASLNHPNIAHNEMLTRRRAFHGDDVSDTLATVLKGEPDWNALSSNVPPAARALIQGCLRKDRKERIGDISTALFLLSQPHALAEAALVAPPPVWRGAMQAWQQLLRIVSHL